MASILSTTETAQRVQGPDLGSQCRTGPDVQQQVQQRVPTMVRAKAQDGEGDRGCWDGLAWGREREGETSRLSDTF